MAAVTGFASSSDGAGPLITPVGSNSGGIGKSVLVKMLASIAEFAGLRVHLIDADPGLGSLTQSLNPRNHSISVFPQTKGEIDQFVPGLIAMESEIDVVLVDLGANTMTRSLVSTAMRHSLAELKVAGWRTSIMLSLPSGKDGLMEDAENFAMQFKPFAQPYLVYRGREEGGSFKDLDLLKSYYPSAELRQLDRGILVDISERGVLPSEYARARPNEFTIAAARMAEALHGLANQTAIRTWLGAEVDLALLDRLRQGGPKRLYHNRVARWQVCDAVLRADEAFLFSEDALLALTPAASEHELRRAHAHWQTCRQARDEARRVAKVAHG